MADVLTFMLQLGNIGVGGPVAIIARFAWWFYGTVIPFIIRWFGIPLFALGAILAIAFAGGTVLFTIIFFIVMFFFIKGVFFDTKPKVI
jgi:hypothetical protein